MRRKLPLTLTVTGLCVLPATAHAGPICSGFLDCLPMILMVLFIQDVLYVALPIFLGCSGYWIYVRFTSRGPMSSAVKAVYVVSGLLLVLPTFMFLRASFGDWRYEREKVEALHNLPFVPLDIADIPGGLETTPYDIDHYFSGFEDVILSSEIRRDVAGDSSRYDDPSESEAGLWAEYHQMSPPDSFPKTCPGPYFSVAKYSGEFSQGCEEVARTDGGNILYRADVVSYQYPRDDWLSARMGEALLVFHLKRKMTSADVETISQLLDSARQMTADDLVEQLD